ncbi:very short patch repair endonuclease [Paracoccus angustae]|uniref:Very short patch repair endonuclease n=1 Tax=Paracoccus angustae TaxID=1671480 RepID=A0ABV7UBF4_9RHOB
MTDFLTPEKRSALMSRVRGKNTKPEMIVRRALHAMGVRYRLHAKELPGKPDIVMRPRRAAIFVHGCFWHSHPGCRRCRIPSSNSEFWAAKLERNRNRDLEALAKLEHDGWRVLVMWECEIKPGERLDDALTQFLSIRKQPPS